MGHRERDADFSAFVAAHRARLVRAARLLTGGRHAEAEDLVQTVLVRLYLRWSRPGWAGGITDPVAYAMRSLTHVFLDEHRRAHHRREVVSEDTPDRAGPGDETDGLDQRAVVLAALEQLAPRQRAVVVLRHFLGFDVAGTAAVLGVTDGTVKSQNAKALARLRELLGTDIEHEDVSP